MKQQRFKAVTFNNRKRQLTVSYRSGKELTVPYMPLGITKTIAEATVDKETGHRSVKIVYQDGTTDYLPYDQPLALSRDPEFLLQQHIEILTADIKEALRAKKISKRYLAEQLQTSDNQIQRLLNPKILNKNLHQLYEVADLVGLQIQLHTVAA